MLSKYTPAIAAKTALVAGCLIIAIGYFVPPFSHWISGIEYHFLGAVFLLLIAYMLLWAKFAGLKAPFVQQDVKAVDMTSWKHAKYVGAALVLVVILIYVSFARF